MKKFLFIISAGLLCCCFSCKDEKSGETGGNSAAQKNLDVAHAINKAIETGDVSKLGDYIAVDGVDHSGEKGEVKGLDSIKAELAGIHNMYSDVKIETIKEVADSEYVFEWWTFSATCTKAQMGMPAGSKINNGSLNITKFKDGKATDHWQLLQNADIMKMMAPQMGMDSTKHM
jgi:predicted ester cyclase